MLEDSTYVNVYVGVPTRCVRWEQRCDWKGSGDNRRQECRDECVQDEIVAGTEYIYGQQVTGTGVEGSEASLPWTSSQILSFNSSDRNKVFTKAEVKTDSKANHQYVLLTTNSGQVIRVEMANLGGGASGGNGRYRYLSYDSSRDFILGMARNAGLTVNVAMKGGGPEQEVHPDRKALRLIEDWEESKRQSRQNRMTDPVSGSQIPVGGRVYRETEELIDKHLKDNARYYQ
jgi:hypothetical protein